MTTTSNPITFTVNGEPIGQPRPRAFARKFGNKFSARVYDLGTAEGWKSQIAADARPHLPEAPIDGPVELTLEFHFRRPKSHWRTGRNAHLLKDDSPTWHQGKPDLDNLSKAVKDAMTALGFWGDDKQVSKLHATKQWSDAWQGMYLTLNPIED